MAAEQEALVRRLFYEVNAGNLDALDDLVAPDYVNRSYTGQGPGPEGLKSVMRAMREAIRNFRYRIDEVSSSGDMVTARVTYTGVHEREFLGNPPTGRDCVLTTTHVFRVVGGRIVERWGELPAPSR